MAVGREEEGSRHHTLELVNSKVVLYKLQLGGTGEALSGPHLLYFEVLKSLSLYLSVTER